MASLRPFSPVFLLRNCYRAVGPGHVNVISHSRLEIERKIFVSGSDFPNQHLQSQPFLFPLGEIVGVSDGPMERLRRVVAKIETVDGFADLDVPSSPSIHSAIASVPVRFDYLDLQRIVSQVLPSEQGKRQQDGNKYGQSQSSHAFYPTEAISGA